MCRRRTVAPTGHPAPAHPAMAPPAPPPVFQPRRPGRLRTALAASGIILAVVLAASALVVALTTRSSSSNTAAPSAGNPAASSSPASTEQADRALCTAIAPLMVEQNKVSNDWFRLGNPARRRGMPGYQSLLTTQKIGSVEPKLCSRSTRRPATTGTNNEPLSR